MQYKIEINTYSDPDPGPQDRMPISASEPTDKTVWSSNGITYPTPEAAQSAASNLFMRWTSVRTWRIKEVA